MSAQHESSELARESARRPVDRCESCGRFVGRYPVGFCCDTHCSRCVCTHCPGFRNPPRYGYREAPEGGNQGP